MVLLQLMADGSLSAAWVLVIVTAACGGLIVMILNGMRNDIKNIIQRQNIESKELTSTTASVRYAHKRIEETNDRIDLIIQNK